MDNKLSKLTIEEQAYDVLLDWTCVEGFVNEMFVWQFQIENFDIPQAKFLVNNLTFQQKYNFLKKQKVFTEKECDHITKFQTQRNALFHGKRGVEVMKGFSEAEINWKKLHTLSKNALDLVYGAFERENKRKWKPFPTQPEIELQPTKDTDAKK